MLFIKILKGINISQEQRMLLFSTGTRTNGIIWLWIHWKSGRCFLAVRREYLEQTCSGSNKHRFLWKLFVLFLFLQKQNKNNNNNMEIILRTHIMKAVHFRFVWKYFMMVESWIWWHSLLYFMFDYISINFVIYPLSMCAYTSCQRLSVLTCYILVTTHAFTDDIFLP